MAEENNLEYDVFISYCHQNKTWVRRVLLRKLEQAGFNVFIDFKSFRVGAASVKEMERGVISSRKTIIVLTPEYLASDWTEFETVIAQTLDPANQNLRILPILKADCNLPLRIKYMSYVDFVKPEHKRLAWPRLLNAIRGQDSLRVSNSQSIAVNNLIPIITFAMNTSELKELLTGTVFKNKDVSRAEHESYNSLIAKLSKNGLDPTELSSYYGESRDDWAPKIIGFIPIREVINTVFKNVNEKTKPSQDFYPLMLSDDFIENSRLAKDLRGKKCILIIDSISLFHPYLIKKLIRSGLVSTQNLNLALVVVPPINHNVISVYEFLEENYMSILSDAFDAFSTDLDIDYEFGIGNMQSLQRWLITNLIYAANQVPKIHESRSAMIDKNIVKPGFQNFIFSGTPGKRT
jgi:hypothetical protein